MGEATLLDAARSFGGSDCLSWDHAMECLTVVDSQALAGTSIDKSKVMWAAQTERFRPRWPAGDGGKSFDAVIGDSKPTRRNRRALYNTKTASGGSCRQLQRHLPGPIPQDQPAD